MVTRTKVTRTPLPPTTLNPDEGPVCLLTFDDEFISIYTTAFPYMQSKGIVGTEYLFLDELPAQISINKDQLLEMQTAGWTIGNHTKTHPDLTADDITTQTSEIELCCDWLLDNGFTGAYHLAYPFGRFNEDTYTAMRSLGMKTGRTIINGDITCPISNLYHLNCYMINNVTTLNTIKGWIDNAVTNNETIILLLHELVTPASDEGKVTVEIFEGMIDYIDSLPITCLNIEEWYNKLYGTRTHVTRTPITRTPVNR